MTNRGGEPSLKISAPQLLRCGSEGVLKIWRKWMTQLMNELISDKSASRIAPATSGLLNTSKLTPSRLLDV